MQAPEIINDGWVDVADLSPSVVLYHVISEEEARWIWEQMLHTRVVAVIEVKGGVKKTTLAVHAAFGLHYQGKHKGRGKVLIVDCDQYHSVADWKAEAERSDEEKGKIAQPWPEEIIVISVSGPNFHFEVAEAVREHRPDYVVIDTPPNDEDAALRALLMADVMISPTGPFRMDIRRLSYGLLAAANAAKLRGHTVVARALITGARMETRIYENARTYLREMGLRFFPTPVRDMVKHAEAFGTNVPKLHDYDTLPDELIPLLDDLMEGKQSA